MALLTPHLRALRPLSATRLAAFRKSEVLFVDDTRDDPSKAELVGLAADALVLEGREVYNAKFTTNGPINPKTEKLFGLDSKAVLDWQLEHNIIVITPEIASVVEAIGQSVASHGLARELLAVGKAQHWIETSYCDLPCCGRLDFYTPPTRFIDFKTTPDLDDFEAAARRWDYAHQMAFYRSLIAAKENLHPFNIECFLIASEKNRPFRTGVWRVGQGVLGIAQQENEAAIARLKRCIQLNTWRTGYEQVRDFDWI